MIQGGFIFADRLLAAVGFCCNADGAGNRQRRIL